MAYPTTIEWTTLTAQMASWDADVNDNFRHFYQHFRPDHALHIFDKSGSVPASGRDQSIWYHYFGASTPERAHIRFGGDTNYDEPAIARATRVVLNRTATTSPNALENGYIYTNTGASSQVTFNLPSAEHGLEYTFINMDANGMLVDVGASDLLMINDSEVSTNVQTTTLGAVLTVVAAGTVRWLAVTSSGGWA